MNRFDKILEGVETILAVIAGLLLLFITISISLSIGLRIFDLQVPLWTVQFNEYALLWVTFLSGAWLLRKGRHVSLDILTTRLKARNLARLSSLHGVMGFLTTGFLGLVSGKVAWSQFQRGIMDVRAVDVPKYLLLSVVCIGFLLMALEFLSQLRLALTRLKQGA